MTEARIVRIALAGYGTVGRALHKIIDERRQAIQDTHGVDLRLVAAARRDRYAVSADGLELGDSPEWIRGNVFEMLGDDGLGQAPDIFVEASPTDLETAQPALGHVRGALRDGMHVVLANKGPLVLAFDEVMERAAEAGRAVRFEATVAAGIPVFHTAQHALAGDPIERVEGILNGTTNFILTRMATEGSEFEQALREAQQLGYAETDPSGDVDGWDAAAKVVILANALLGRGIGIDDVEVTGIRGITRNAVELARAHGYTIRLVGEVDADVARVGPRLVPHGRPLDVGGALNAVQIQSPIAGATTLIGAGAGGAATAGAILSDILACSNIVPGSL